MRNGILGKLHGEPALRYVARTRFSDIQSFGVVFHESHDEAKSVGGKLARSLAICSFARIMDVFWMVRVAVWVRCSVVIKSSG